MTSKTMNSGAVKLLLVSGTMASITSALLGAPQGERVVRGNVQFNRNGDLTRIWASNGAIINYRQFNIAANETVQFIQPNSRSRVLNRVLDKDPTVIAGTLLANGRVYIVNPAGVSIRNGALIDVAGMYAAAGNISDDDFARGINRFTNLTGNVVNEGTINAAQVVLAGAGVSNAGTINAPGGYVAMAAGNDVLVGEQGGTMFVRVQAAAPGAKAGAGIENTGTINAAGGTYAAATGDMFAMAIMQGGQTTASTVNIQGGNNTQTIVTGTIDASGKNNNTATGGTVTVVSHQVAVMNGASIDASGPSGGGTVQIGGGYQGQGTPTTAMTATVLDGAVINADATEDGNGGQIIVWSEWYTGFGGSASVRAAGNGNGGLIETSSRLTLDVAGSAKIFASGAGEGKAGMWLLDPQDMIVSNAANSNISALPLVNPTNAAVPGNVNADAIRDALNGPVDGVADGADVVITTALLAGTANGDLTWTANAVWSLDAAEPDNRSLTLRANRNITFTAGSLLSTTSNPLDLFLQAGNGLDAAGGAVDPGDPANTTLIAGGITLIGGGNVVGTGNNFTITDSGAMLVVGTDLMSLLYTGTLNLAGDLITFDGLMTLGANASAINVFGTSLIRNGFIAQGDGGITFDGNTTLQGSPTIASNGGSIRFQDGSLTLNDNQTIDADDGAGGPTTTGEVHFHGPVNSQPGEANDLTVHAGTDIHLFANNMGGTIGAATVLGTVTFNLEPGGTFRAETDGGTIGIFAGDITVNGNTVLDDTGVVHFHADQTFLGATSTVTFNGDIQSTQGDETDLRVSAVAINFNGNLGQGGASNVVGDVILRDQTNANSAATLATVNSTAWNVRGIDAGTTVLVSNGGLALDIASDLSTFRFELQSDSNLVDLSFVGTGFNNDVDFQGSVGLPGGSNVAFGSLRVAGNATLREEISVNTTSAGGATGDQDYEGPVLINDNPQISANTEQAVINATGGVVTFYDTVDDNGTSSGFSVNGRVVDFQGLVGTNDDVDGLAVVATERIIFSFTGSSTTGINVGSDAAAPDGASFTAPRIELATEGEFLIQNDGGSSVEFHGLIADVGNGTDWMNVENTGGLVLFDGDIGTGVNEAIGRLIVTADTIEFRSTVLSTDAGGFDGDQIYNGNVVLNSAGRTHRFAYIGAVYALGTSADLGATSAVIDPTFGFGDISFRGTINSFDNGVSNNNNGMLVETSGRREFQGSIGTGTDRSFLAFLTTGGDANIAGADPVANPGIDLLGDTAGSAITIKSFANTDGTDTGNITFWGPTYLDNDVTFFLGRNGGPGGTDDIAGERELTFTRTLDSFDTTLRNLDVSTSFRTWFRGDVGNGNTSGGAVPDAGRLLTSDVTAEDIFRGVIFGGVPADPWIRLGEESTGGASSYVFLTNSPAGVDVVAQRFNGPVRLDSDVTVDDDNNGDIIFETIVDSFNATAQRLQVNTGGRGWFRGNVGTDFFLLDTIDTDSAQENNDDGTYLGFEGNTIEMRTASTNNSAAFGSHIGNAIDFDDRVFLDGDAIVAPQNGGGVHFHDTINTSDFGLDNGLHALTVNSSGTVIFYRDIGWGFNGYNNGGPGRALRRLVTDVPGFTRFGQNDADHTVATVLRVRTDGSTTDIGDPVSLDTDLEVTELNEDGLIRFRGAINSFDSNFRALRLLTPGGGRTELWGNIGTGFIASAAGDPDGSSGVPNDAVNRALRFIQTDGFGITQLGNNSDNIGANQRNAQITIRTAGDPQTGAITSNDFNAIDMQDAVELDASYTFDTQNARNLRFYETINSIFSDNVNHLTAVNRSITIDNDSGSIAFDDNIGTTTGAFGNGRLSFILTDTDGAGNSGTVRLGNASGQFNVSNVFNVNSSSNGAATNVADGAAINIQTSAAQGVQLGDQFINLDADIEIDAAGGGTVNFGANALTGFVNSQDRSAIPGVNTDLNSAADGDDIYRGLTINTSGATRFFNTVGAQSFTNGLGLRRLAYIRTDYVLNTESGTVGSGTTRFDSNVFVQGRESAQAAPAAAVAGQQRRIGMTINDSMIIGDNVNNGTTNGVTIDSLITGGYTGVGGGALRFRGNVITDGTQRDLFLLTNAQTFTRSLYFSFTQSQRNNWAANMLAPVAFGGDVGSSGGRFQSVNINQPDISPFGVRGTGLLADNGNVPVVSTIFWADGGSAWGTDDAWSLSTGSVGDLDSSLNTTTFDVWTTGRAASGGRIVGIDFGQNEKGTAFGNLELKSSTGQIFIGDLNAVGERGRGATSGRLIVGESGNSFVCSDTQKTIMVRTRTSGRTVRFFGSNLKTRSDQGTDFVANKIKFLSTPGLVAASTNVEGGVDKHRIQFSTPDGGHVTINGDSNPPWIVRAFGESLYERQFVNNFNSTVHLFDLPARGISQSEKATAWAKEGWLSAPHEVWPANMSWFSQFSDMEGTVGDPVLLSNAERKSLEGINVMTRTQTPAQMMDNLIGREFFNDRPNASDAASASDQARAVSLPRLNKKAASALAAEAQKIMSGSGDTAKAMALIDQLGVTPTEAAAMKASLQRRSGVPAK